MTIGDYMRKNELIKLLQEIPGNPDVVIWNGFVEDYQHPTKPEAVEFRRIKKNFQAVLVNSERTEKGQDPMTEEEYLKYPQNDWELPCYSIFPEHEEKRNMIVLDMKERGKEVFNRMGTTRY